MIEIKVDDSVMTDRILELVKIATDKNVIVFDNDGLEMTDRLIALMKAAMRRRNNGDSLKTIIIPNDSNYPENEKYGVEIVISHLFGKDSVVEEYYFKELEGHVPYKCHRVILGIGKFGDVILGAYPDNE